ncbi:MAG: VWA domain-containing protein [Bryobacteraceae bacterium]
MPKHRSRSRQRGVSLMLAGVSLLFIVPAVGLMIDVSVLYSVKAQFQAAVDGAALAAARALNLGQTTAAQATSAQNNAVNWFYANFPSGAWGTTGTNMSNSTVTVFDDASNSHVRNVTVNASTNVPSFFMSWFGASSTPLAATGNASRRDVVVMMVLDRSGSMSGACSSIVTAAKLFTGQFAAGRDQIGLVSFSDNVYIHSSPTTSFQTTLGYKNNLGSGTGALDTITCNSGGTSTAQAISVAYNEIYKIDQPGALNVIMFETDGLPNTLTLNFWDSASGKTALTSGSTCTDTKGKKVSQGGFATASVLPSWTPGQSLGSGSYYANIPAGMIGGVYSYDPNTGNKLYLLFKYWATTTSNNFNSSSFTTASGCAFNSSGGQNPSPPPSDIAWYPTTDVWGNQLSPGYLPVSLSSGKVVASSWQTFHNAALNAADSAASQARTNATLPAYFFVIGLGGTSTNPPDYVLMQRIANDPNGDNYNSPPLYSACSQETNCATSSSQPQGTFIFSSSPSQLAQAFLSISSEVLRLSK